MAAKTSIPIVDLSAFGSAEGNTKSRSESARALYEACHALGFVQILGHGVAPELLRQAFDWSERLFSLSHDAKMKAPHPDGPVPHRGSCCSASRGWVCAGAKVTRLLSSGLGEGLLERGEG